MALPTASDNIFPKVSFVEGAAPSSPAATNFKLYFDSSDHLLKWKNSAGTVTTIATGSSGGIATDPIWTTAGQLAVATGSATASALAKGAAGGALSMINAAVAWNSGTSFPGSAVTGDRYWRTDLALEFYFDGTRWLTTTLYHMHTNEANVAAATAYTGPSGTLTYDAIPTPAIGSGSDIWLVSLDTHFFVNGGTALDGSNKWVTAFGKTQSNNTSTTVITVTINSGSSSVWRSDTQSIGALLNNGTTFYIFTYIATKTGTPGPLFQHNDLTYRVVAT